MGVKKIIVSVSSDLTTDQRVAKVCSSLHNANYEVMLLGRKLASSPPLSKRNYPCNRFDLWFNKGVLFYANLNIQLFFYLLFKKSDGLLANDLDTLPANYLVSKIKNIPLVYDSHEYFTEVPELQNRPFVKGVWERIEKAILPKLQFAITVSEKIAEIYFQKYGCEFKLVRNFPIYREHSDTIENKEIILYQGALNAGRGLEELIESMQFIDTAELWLAGAGDLVDELKKLVAELNLESKVKLLGRLTPDELKRITQKAKIGVSLEKKLGLNYTYALPNKIFDYIHAGVPVLYSSLEEVVTTLRGYNVGEELKSHEPQKLAQQLNEMLNSPNYAQWEINCNLAAKELNWQKEEPHLLAIFKAAFSN
ncbi:MAG: glycosyltransferase [Vicingaceae bacterium]